MQTGIVYGVRAILSYLFYKCIIYLVHLKTTKKNNFHFINFSTALASFFLFRMTFLFINIVFFFQVSCGWNCVVMFSVFVGVCLGKWFIVALQESLAHSFTA